MIQRRSGAAPGRVACLVACAIAGIACASGRHLPAPEGGGVEVPPEAAVAFHQRALVFYDRLIQRRFNTLETFNDPVLREHFASMDLFFDYYADLAQALDNAHFEKSRPRSVEVQEFLFEDSDRARVQVRIEGLDGRPLRPGKSALIRRDRWERADGTWLVVPGRL